MANLIRFALGQRLMMSHRSHAPAWERIRQRSSVANRDAGASLTAFPRRSARRYTHLEVGRNKPVRAAARTGVSGKHLPNSPETPPRAMRLDGLIPAYIRVRHSSVHSEMTLFDRLAYKDERRSVETIIVINGAVALKANWLGAMNNG